MIAMLVLAGLLTVGLAVAALVVRGRFDYRPPITWPGAGPHEGHTVRFVEKWEARVRGGTLTAGRVACSCGESWTVGGWPVEVYHRIMAR